MIVFSVGSQKSVWSTLSPCRGPKRITGDSSLPSSTNKLWWKGVGFVGDEGTFSFPKTVGQNFTLSSYSRSIPAQTEASRQLWRAGSCTFTGGMRTVWRREELTARKPIEYWIRGEVMIGMVVCDEDRLDRSRRLASGPFNYRFGVWDQKGRIDDGRGFGAYDKRCDTGKTFFGRCVDVGLETHLSEL